VQVFVTEGVGVDDRVMDGVIVFVIERVVVAEIVCEKESVRVLVGVGVDVKDNDCVNVKDKVMDGVPVAVRVYVGVFVVAIEGGSIISINSMKIRCHCGALNIEDFQVFGKKKEGTATHNRRRRTNLFFFLFLWRREHQNLPICSVLRLFCYIQKKWK
jgi:hypothetical protein